MAQLSTEFSKAKESFVDYLKIERGLSPKTIEAYERDVTKYLFYCQREGVKTVEQSQRKHVETFLGSHTQASAASMHRILAAIRHFHRFCLRENLSTHNPSAVVVGPRRPTSVPKALSVSDASRLVEGPVGTTVIALRDRALLEVIYGGGLRVSEATNLDVDDVDLEAHSVRCKGKGSKQRVVPLGRSAVEALSQYLASRGELTAKGKGTAAMFVSARGARLTRQSVWLLVKHYGAKTLGTTAIHPHVLRHSYATHLVQGGADLRIVQEALGHARISTTQVYTLVERDTLKEAIDRAHPSRSPKE